MLKNNCFYRNNSFGVNLSGSTTGSMFGEIKLLKKTPREKLILISLKLFLASRGGKFIHDVTHKPSFDFTK